MVWYYMITELDGCAQLCSCQINQLLGWMHRKLKQTGGEPFTIGNSCNCLTGQPSLDDQQQYCPQPNYAPRSSRPFQKDLLRKSFALLQDGDFEYEPSDTTSELFHGLLAIGTLGSDAPISEPETPTFAESFENVTEKGGDVTENDLKIINDELEKVLAADMKDESSSERTSHVSSITLGGNENGLGTCPLQGYLFGSPFAMPETCVNASGKKEHRTSLGELFQMSKIEEEKRDREKSMKNNSKRRILRSSSTAAQSVPTDSLTTETKLNKILQMFHRKVHPEGSVTEKKYVKPQKNGNKNNMPHDGRGPNHVEHNARDEDIIMIPKRSISKLRRYKSNLNPATYTVGSVVSNDNKECWIKTDAEYLVLEL